MLVIPETGVRRSAFGVPAGTEGVRHVALRQWLGWTIKLSTTAELDENFVDRMEWQWMSLSSRQHERQGSIPWLSGKWLLDQYWTIMNVESTILHAVFIAMICNIECDQPRPRKSSDLKQKEGCLRGRQMCENFGENWHDIIFLWDLMVLFTHYVLKG